MSTLLQECSLLTNTTLTNIKSFLTVILYLFYLLQQPIDHSIMANSRSSTIHKEDGYSLHPTCNLPLVYFIIKIIYELT